MPFKNFNTNYAKWYIPGSLYHMHPICAIHTLPVTPHPSFVFTAHELQVEISVHLSKVRPVTKVG
jgi:hypothetical protein